MPLKNNWANGDTFRPEDANAVADTANSAYVKPGTGIPASDLDSSVNTALGKANTAYQKPGGGIPSTDLAATVGTSLNLATTAYQKPVNGIPASDLNASVNSALASASGGYTKPVGGIPASDLAAAVNTSLGKADTAYQKPVGGILASDLKPKVLLGAKFYHVDDYGADPTGVADSNQALIDAYTAMGSNPGVIVFGVGTYKLFIGLNEAQSRLLRPQQGVIGQGSGLTTIDYRGAGAFLEFRNKLFGTTEEGIKPHGGCHGLRILGWSNGNSNTCGIRYGDIWRMRISDVEINGFNQPGSKGLWGDNQTHWSERAHIECVASQCTECFVFSSNTGDMGSGSFDYSQYWLSFVVQPDQHAFVLRADNPATGRTSMNGAEIHLTGNCQLAPINGTNTGVLFRVGATNADSSAFSGTLDIGVETSGTVGGVAHFDFMQGTGSFWEIQSRVSATGAINLIPYSGTNFQKGNATARTFAFGGLLKGSPSFGSTGSVQSFQSLQLVSQARGGYFLDTTSAIHTVYVTQATGGTFTLSYNGQTTSALPYNASPAAVEAALTALSSIGAGNVYVMSGQKRYINSLPVDEIAFTVGFQGTLTSIDVPMITGNGAGLTGTSPSVSVVEKREGSPNGTYVVYLEHGSIFTLDPSPGTYRMTLRIGGLTAMPGNGIFAGDSPFGVNLVDIWVKQPDTGGPAIFEPQWFAPPPEAGSTYSFRWIDGQEPVLSTTPGAVDIIRLASYNFGVWVGSHATKLSTTNVPAPATATSPGVKGQIAYDSSYIYTCVDVNTWKRSPLSTW